MDDFTSYLDKKLQAIYNASADTPKRWANLCAAGEFSSDRAIQEYADSIWKIRPVCENSARFRVS
ncbi:MAG: glycogen/starch/alpha-glucan phosphorylase [Oscillospiraceae bacterium]